MKLDKNYLYDLLDYATTDPELSSKAYELMEALDKDNLEIEGYDKTEWVVFDSDNPSTYPPDGGFYFVKCHNGIIRKAHYHDGDENLEFWKKVSSWLKRKEDYTSPETEEFNRIQNS